MRRAIKLLSHSKLLVAALLMALGAFVFAGQATVNAADCDDNAIMYCGTGSASNFINTVQKNSDGKNHHDLQTVYAQYGLVPSNYSRFVTSARPGTAFRDGRIVVDGQTVATNAKSIGRLASFQGAGYFSTTIGGTTYYGNSNSQAFASGTTSLPVMVMFDSRGVMQFAVMNTCGNPTYGTNVVPQYSCDALRKTAVAGKLNTYSFTTAATATNNAKLVKVVYNFGDNSPLVTKTSLNDAVTHTYTKAGNFTASVTVYVSLPGNQTITVTSVKCKTVISVQLPFADCVQLNGAIIDKAKFSFSFTATAKFGNGATFTSADFDFGDHTSAKGVKPTGNTVTTTHMYAAAGDYRIVATLHFNVGGTQTNRTCSAVVSPTQPPTPECRPGVPQGSPLCAPCPTNPAVPASDTASCTTTLPNTGAGDVIGISGVVALLGFFFWRQFIHRKRAMQVAGEADVTGLQPTGIDTPSEPTLEQQVHRNQQGLSRSAYHQPHRFRPRSHQDHEE